MKNTQPVHELISGLCFLCSQKTSIHVNSFLKINLSLCSNLCDLSNWQLISSFCNKKESGVFPLPNGWKLGLHKLPTAVNFQYPIKHFLWREGERLNQSKILKLRLFSLKSRTLTTSLSICPTTVSTVKSLAQLPRTLACRSK